MRNREISMDRSCFTIVSLEVSCRYCSGNTNYISHQESVDCHETKGFVIIAQRMLSKGLVNDVEIQVQLIPKHLTFSVQRPGLEVTSKMGPSASCKPSKQDRDRTVRKVERTVDGVEALQKRYKENVSYRLM